MSWRAVLASAALATLALAAPAQARDAVVTSFDGTPIVAHFFPGASASKARPAPTIMVGPGWSIPGETNPDGGSIAGFIDAGYNVLTWDPRGFGGSGGTVMINSPTFEGRDAQALIDFISTQEEARLDAPGDPRLGMSGGSYGGGIQLVLAGIDSRVDAIAPTIAWNSLTDALFREGKVKVGWGLVLAGRGRPALGCPGDLQPGRGPDRSPEPAVLLDDRRGGGDRRHQRGQPTLVRRARAGLPARPDQGADAADPGDRGHPLRPRRGERQLRGAREAGDPAEADLLLRRPRRLPDRIRLELRRARRLGARQEAPAGVVRPLPARPRERRHRSRRSSGSTRARPSTRASASRSGPPAS